jgi:ferredoxin
VVIALGEIGDARAIVPLEGMLEDADPDVRKLAAACARHHPVESRLRPWPTSLPKAASTASSAIAWTSARWTASTRARNFLTIDPEACIDCGVCVPECPTEGICDAAEVPAGQERFVAINAELSKTWPLITERPAQALPDADRWSEVKEKIQHLHSPEKELPCPRSLPCR